MFAERIRAGLWWWLLPCATKSFPEPPSRAASSLALWGFCGLCHHFPVENIFYIFAFLICWKFMFSSCHFSVPFWFFTYYNFDIYLYKTLVFSYFSMGCHSKCSFQCHKASKLVNSLGNHEVLDMFIYLLVFCAYHLTSGTSKNSCLKKTFATQKWILSAF